MSKSEYGNPLGNQALSLLDMVDAQLEACFDEKTLSGLMSMAEIFNVRKIFITGCGDSIAAAGAFAGVMRKFTGAFHCEMIEPMEFTRFLKKEEAGIGEPDSPLVIAISAGGGTARITEVLQKANRMGAFTILLTNNRESVGAQNAKRVFCLNTPKMPEDFPGLRSYFASITGLIALAARIGRVRNILPPTALTDVKQAVSAYVHSYEAVMERIDSQMFELAGTWKEFEQFDFIGDGPELYSALFALEKFVETNGVTGNFDDSEDWCHINYHVKNPDRIGTILFADRHSNAYGRERETAAAACGIGRPLLVITNGPAADFPKAANVCCIPDTEKGYEWLMPLMDYVPASLLAGYTSALAGRKFFNEYDIAVHEYNGGGVFFNPSVMTMKSSEIQICL